MERYTFKTRDEVINFLEQYDFNYYVPRLEEVMDALRIEDKFYSVEITDEKVSFCCIDRTWYSAYSFNCKPFYDDCRPEVFPSKEQGEMSYLEWLEYGSY